MSEYTPMVLPLVPDEHDDHVAVAVLPGVLQPGGEVVEGVPPGDIVHQQGPGSSAVVRPGDGSEGFLSSLQDCRLTAGVWHNICWVLYSQCPISGV